MVFKEDEAKTGDYVEARGGTLELPSGWTQHWSTEHNHVYYAHAVTQQVTWKHPTLALEQARGESLQHQRDEKAELEVHPMPALAGGKSKAKPIETLRKETEEKLRKETGEMVKAKEELKRRRKAVAETKAMHRAMVGKIKKVKANAKSKARKIVKGNLENYR